MAIDTAAKRYSALRFVATIPLVLTLPLADGSFSSPDKQHLLGLYSGVSAAAPPDIVVASFPTHRRHVMPGGPI